jgi:hypothetical protein
MPHNCRCIRDGSIEEILAESLVPGDIIEVNTGDRIPADIRLFEVSVIFYCVAQNFCQKNFCGFVDHGMVLHSIHNVGIGSIPI